MIFTTYIGRIKRIPDSAKIYLITRFLPRDWKLAEDKYLTHVSGTLIEGKVIEWLPELSPDSQYVMGGNTKATHQNIRDKFHNDSNVHSVYDAVAAVNKSKDIFLVCYEHLADSCHRREVARIFEEEYGIPQLEWRI